MKHFGYTFDVRYVFLYGISNTMVELYTLLWVIHICYCKSTVTVKFKQLFILWLCLHVCLLKLRAFAFCSFDCWHGHFNLSFNHTRDSATYSDISCQLVKKHSHLWFFEPYQFKLYLLIFMVFCCTDDENFSIKYFHLVSHHAECFMSIQVERAHLKWSVKTAIVLCCPFIHRVITEFMC